MFYFVTGALHIHYDDDDQQ